MELRPHVSVLHFHQFFDFRPHAPRFSGLQTGARGRSFSEKSPLPFEMCTGFFFFFSHLICQQVIIHALPVFLVASARLTTSDKNVSDQKQSDHQLHLCFPFKNPCGLSSCLWHRPRVYPPRCSRLRFQSIIIRKPRCAPPNQAQSRPHHRFNTILRRIQFSPVSIITQPLRQSLYYTGDTSERCQP